MPRLVLVTGLVGVSLAAIVACSSSNEAKETGPTEAPGPDAQIAPVTVQRSGTRLKVKGLETAEGTFVGGPLFDSKLGVDCSAGRAEDGKVRCIPSAAPATYFTNDSCTAPVAEVGRSQGCEPPKFAEIYLTGANACDGREKILRVGAMGPAPRTLYWKDGDNCVETATSPFVDYYYTTSAVAPSELVALTVSEVALTPSLRALAFDGDDGSRIQRGDFVDAARGKACSITLASDAKTRCTPKTDALVGNDYSDTSCSTPVGTRPSCSSWDVFDDSTVRTVEGGDGTCKLSTVHAFPIQTKRSTRAAYFKAGSDEEGQVANGKCTSMVTAPRDVLDLGPEIAAATLPEITVATAGGPRIVEKTYASDGVAVFHTGELTDTKLGVRCTYNTGPDGKYRCFPQGFGSLYFTDAQCQQRIGSTWDTCELADAKYIVLRESSSCSSLVMGAFLVAGKLDSATTPVFTNNNGACAPVPPRDANVLALYTLGAEVPLSTFAEGKPVTK